MQQFFDTHSGEMLILAILLVVLAMMPQVLRFRLRYREMQHDESMRALEQGHRPPLPEVRFRTAGWVAALSSVVSICTAGIVTCFLVVCRSDHVFSVSLAVWCVTGVVSLAAITGGVALMGRLAHFEDEEEEDELEANSAEK